MAPLPARARRGGGRRVGRVLVLEVPGSVAVCFDAPVVELFEQRTEALHPSLSKLGPDLLADPVDVDEAMRRLRSPERADLTVAEALLDQRALAGIGNEVKNLVLWEAGLSPWTPLRDVDDAALRGLVDRSAEVLRIGAATGRRPLGPPRPGRAPVPAMRDDRAGEGARPRAAAPDLLVPDAASPSRGARHDRGHRRPLRAHRGQLDLLRDGDRRAARRRTTPSR